MIPFTTPQTGEILNLSQILRIRVICGVDEPGSTEIEVYFSDGSKRIYTDQAALVLLGEVGFSLDAYRKYQMAATSQIVGVDGNSPARIM